MGRRTKTRSARLVPTAAHTAGPPERTPRAPASVDVYRLTPTWSFSILDVWWGDAPEAGCGWIHLHRDHHRALLDRLQAFERMTWGEILMARQSPHHPIPVAKLFKPAQDRLRARQLEDLDEVVSLRVNSKARVFGVLDAGVFRILWWDPDHRVCPSTKRST